MFKKVSYLFCLLCIAGIYRCFAQDPGQTINPTVKRVIPPSPTSAALGKYGDIPVNENVGLPTIAIPLYTIPSNEFAVPISLSYHAGGIKVEEDASWVGLGWSLNAGGVITRTMHGKPDEIGYTAGDGALIPPNGIINPYDKDGHNLLKNITKNFYDLQPDEYFFNFGKYTGKFLMTPNGDIRLIPYSKLRVIKQTIDGNITFSITTEDGTIYQFTATESTEAIATEDFGPTIPRYISSWYLTSITSPYTTNAVTFNYAPYVISRSKNVSYTQYWNTSNLNGVATLASSSISYNNSLIKGIHLASINYANGRIEFIPKNEARQDIAGDQALETIKIYGNNNQLIKSWKLQYTYYNNNSSDPLDKRLQLQQVQEVGNNGTLLSPYVFNYNALQLPSVTSQAQDHWGFYNGEYNSTLVPAGKIGNVIIKGAERRIVEAYVKAGILEKINYPTGGSTNFDFESNTVGANESEIWTYSAYVICRSGPKAKVNSCIDEKLFTLDEACTVDVHDAKLLPSPGNIVSLTIVNTVTKEVTDLGKGGSGSGVYLDAGIYKLVATTQHEEPIDGEDLASCNISWKVKGGTVKTKIDPGLRIKIISSSDGITGSLPVVTRYVYNTFTDNAKSSGSLLASMPDYEYSFQAVNTEAINSNVNYIVRTSYSQSDLGNGGTVSYTNVKKILGENGENGSVNSYYSVFPSEGGGGYPFAPKIDKNYKDGLLTRQTTFNNKGQMVKDITNSYKYSTDNNYSSVSGLSVGYYKRNAADYGGTMIDFQNNSFLTVLYSYISEWFYLNITNSITYDENGQNPSTSTTSYEYQNPIHCQPTNITTTVENGGNSKRLATRILYPQDYNLTGTLSGTAAVIKNMADRHMINVPIEQLKFSIKGWDIRVVGGQVTTYKMNNNFLTKDRDFKLRFNSEGTTNQDLITFAPSAITSSGNFTLDPHYKETNVYNEYDANNNLLEIKDHKNIYSFIREPGTGNVWAKTLHTNYNDIAYSSFEHEDVNKDFTRWLYSNTNIVTLAAFNGNKALKLKDGDEGYVRSMAPLSKYQNYKISFWAIDGTVNVNTIEGENITSKRSLLTLRTGPTRQGWTYYEGVFSNAYMILLGGSATIDELRLYPVNARMHTYVYKMAQGIISECNENNQKTDYLYDEFNRLKLVKDQDGNILKKSEYQYQAPY